MKVYRRFLASYLCVCLVPLLLSLVTIGRLEHRITASIMENQESSMMAFRQEVDQLLGSAATVATVFSQDVTASRLAQETALSPQELFDLKELSESFSTVVGQNDGFYRGFCYFARSGFLVTDRRTYHPQSTDLFAWDLQLEPDNLYAIFDSGSNAEHIATVYKKTGGGWLMALRCQYDAQRRELLSCVGIAVQMDKSLSSWNDEDFEAFVTDEAYNLLSGGERAAQACQPMSQSGESQGELDLDGQRYVFSQYRSSLGGVRYGFLTRREAYYQELRMLWVNLMMELLVIFGVSVALAVVWSKRTYRPIKGLLPFVAPRPEYRSITELGTALVSFAQEKESLACQVEQSEQQARSAALAQYLLGLTDSPSGLSQYLEEGQPYQLLAFTPAGGPGSGLALSTLRECLDDILLDKSGGVSLELPWCALVLVQRALSYDQAAEAHFAAEHSLSAPLVCYMSDACTHLEDAPQAWASIYQVLRRDGFWGQGRGRGVWQAGSLLENDTPGSYGDFLSRQKLLAEYLAAGKVQRAEKCLREILAQDLSNRALPVEMIWRRCADLVEILLPYIGEEQEGPGAFWRYETAGQMEAGLLGLFGRIAWEEKPELSEMKRELTGRVQAYIRENYRDPALNASMIADYMGMNLSTLSHQYKAATGSGVLDELHTVRLEAAKSLLAEGASVRETAERTGYAAPRALIRAFKRYEGLTPGQYAKQTRTGV